LAQPDPEIGLLVRAVAEGARALGVEPFDAERGKRAVVERDGARDVRNADGHMVQHGRYVRSLARKYRGVCPALRAASKRASRRLTPEGLSRCSAAMMAHVEASHPGDVPNAGAVWRSDIDALAFRLDQHSASCMVHRRAFRTLLGFDPAPADCLQ